MVIQYHTEDLTWTTHIDTLGRKAKQRLYHLRHHLESPGGSFRPSTLVGWRAS